MDLHLPNQGDRKDDTSSFCRGNAARDSPPFAFALGIDGSIAPTMKALGVCLLFGKTIIGRGDGATDGSLPAGPGALSAHPSL